MEAENLKASRTKAEITIAGKNVMAFLEPYLTGITYNSKTSSEVDDITITLEDRDAKFSDEWMPEISDPLTVSIITTDEKGKEHRLDCGNFEIDLVTDSGPPNICQIKAVNTLNSPIRKELVNKQWKNTTLKGIFENVAKNRKLKYKFVAETDESDAIKIVEINQHDQSDLTFLSKLADDYGYVIKVDAISLTLCSQKYLESQEPIARFTKEMISNRQSGRQGFNLYKEARVSYVSPRTKKTIKGNATPKLINNKEVQAKYDAQKSKNRRGRSKKAKSDKTPTKPTVIYSGNGGSKTLIIHQYFSSDADAKRFAEAQLRKKNSGEWKISGEVKGCHSLEAGTVIAIDDYGQYTGLYFVEEATHSIGSGGYRTSFVAHRTFNSIYEVV